MNDPRVPVLDFTLDNRFYQDNAVGAATHYM